MHLIALGTLTICNTGCSINHSQYKFNEKIAEDKITFTERKYHLFSDNNILTEIKPDGRIIKYVDNWSDDLKLEYVDITTKNGSTTRYTIDNKVVLKKAQENFDTRMKQILEINTNKKQQIKENRINKGLEYLK